MTQQLINIGSAPGDSTGDPARIAYDKCNLNFTELYDRSSSVSGFAEYRWDTSTTPPPGSGYIQANNATFASATALYFHNITNNGSDIKRVLTEMPVGASLVIQDQANNVNFAKYNVTATPIDHSTYVEFPVTCADSGGTFFNNSKMLVAMTGGGGGGGNVSNSGTPTAGQYAIWTDATHIQGITATYLTGNQTVTLSGDVSGSGATTITTTFATVNSNVGTFQGITVNAKGLVTAAANQNYLTANQTVTLSGDVTGSGATTITATIANGAVTNAKHANSPANSIKGNNTGTAAAPIDMTGTQATALLDVFTSSLKGLAPSSGGGTTNFLRADGTWTAPSAGSGTTPKAIRVFTTSTTYTPTVGTIAAVVECLGGGGAGGSTAAAQINAACGGGGGGSGGYSRRLISNPTTQTITIGAGGNAAAAGNNAGGSGGDTSFGALCIGKGGTGGPGYAGSGAGTTGGAGGVAGTGDVMLVGNAGMPSGQCYSGGFGQQFINRGGPSILGGGTGYGIAGAPPNSANGVAGIVYGSGGSGGQSCASTSVVGATAAGGAGSAGIVIVTEFG